VGSGRKDRQAKYGFVFFVALFLTLSGAVASVAAQTDAMIEPDGSATVSVERHVGPISIGGSTPAPGPWPYTCEWNEWHIYLSFVPTPSPTRGEWYELTCTHATDPAQDIYEFTYQYDPVAGTPTLGLVNSGDLAAAAQANLLPPPLPVGLSPDPLQTDQITGVETWLWPDGPLVAGTQSATATNLSAWVTAYYRGTVFDMGNGDTVTCDVRVEWVPGATSSPCVYTYWEEGTYEITATSDWQYVWWDNALQPGEADLGTVPFVETLTIEVVDLEAVISR